MAIVSTSEIEAAFANQWQDVRCLKCGKLFTDPKNAHIQHDVTTGGLKGVHDICPPAEPSPLVAATQPAELTLLLTTARILHALLLEMPPPFCDQDRQALTEALAPFGPAPDEAAAGAEEISQEKP